MKVLSKKDIQSLDSVFRVHFMNCITGFKSANLIGTKNRDGIANLAIHSSVTHMGSDPAIIGFFVRPGDSPSNTFTNIQETGQYTINHIPKNRIAEAHQSSAKYDSSVSEFNILGFTEEYSSNLGAPFVEESRIKIGMEYREKYPIQINGTVLVVGEVVEIRISDHLILEDGHINLNLADTVAISGVDTYHKAEKLKRFNYAKPNKKLKEIL